MKSFSFIAFKPWEFCEMIFGGSPIVQMNYSTKKFLTTPDATAWVAPTMNQPVVCSTTAIIYFFSLRFGGSGPAKTIEKT